MNIFKINYYSLKIASVTEMQFLGDRDTKMFIY